MKTIQTLRNRLLKSNTTRLKTELEQDVSKTQNLISRSFSKDEDTFMFI